MSEIVDRVARALLPVLWPHVPRQPQGDGTSKLIVGPKQFEEARSLARAAIAAMREPTKAIWVVGNGPHSPASIWNAMIDAALFQGDDTCVCHIHATEITGVMGQSHYERQVPCNQCDWGHP